MKCPSGRTRVPATRSGKLATNFRSASVSTNASDSLPKPTEYRTPCDAPLLEQATDWQRWRKQSATPARQKPLAFAVDVRIAVAIFPALSRLASVRCVRKSRAAFRLTPRFRPEKVEKSNSTPAVPGRLKHLA